MNAINNELKYKKRCDKLKENDLKPGTIFYINPAGTYWKVREWTETKYFEGFRHLMIADWVGGKKKDVLDNRAGSWLGIQCVNAIKRKVWTILSVK